jgi:hypothetical protein
MANFVDKLGVTWKLSLDFGILKEIKEETGVRIALMEYPIVLPDDQPADMWAGIPGVVRLHQDLELTFAIIWVLCRQQVQDLQLTQGDFVKRIAEKGVQTAAFHAFWQEIRDFFQSLRKDQITKLIDGYQKVLSAAMKQIDREIATRTTLTTENENSRNLSGDKPDTLASIHDDSLSVNSTG